MDKKRDHHGRVIDYLRISVTDLCNQRCKYCMPKTGVDKLNHDQMLKIEDIIKLVKVAALEGIKKVRITGGEPLVKRGLINLIKSINTIDGIEDIGLTTNGTLLRKYAKDLKNAGLSRINISLDTLNPLNYNLMTRGGDIEDVLDGIKASKEVGLDPIKINTVLIGGFNNNEIEDFMIFVKKNNLSWRLIELMPIGEVSNWSSENFVNGEKLLNNNKDLVLDNTTKNNRVKIYFSKKHNIYIGLINTLTGKFCGSCNRIRLTSDGKLKPCLHSNLEYDITPYLDNLGELREFYNACILNKPKEHNILDKDFSPITRNMNRIGG